MKLKEGTDDRCCGACKCFLYEDIDGEGYCATNTMICYCGDVCDNFKEIDYETSNND